MRILLACVCGMLVGIERSQRQKEAGIRTHFVVGCASALIMVVRVSFSSDQARVAAQIVSGIGFLCAGMIIFRRESLHGLTTAAGIWATAGIGMAMGKGLYAVAFGSTLIIIMAQSVFHSKCYRLKNYPQLWAIKFIYSKECKQRLQEYFGFKEYSRFKVIKTQENWIAEAVIRPEKNTTVDHIADITVNNPDIISIERLEDL